MKLGFIGGGKMAEAIIRSVLQARVVGQQAVFVSDVSAERRELLKREFGVNVYSHNGDVVAAATVLFLAVKPQDFGALMGTLADRVREDQLVVSIAAGRTIHSIEAALPHGRVVRVMPNLPCQVGEGMSVYCLGSRALPADGRTVQTLLESSGKALELPESAFDAVTALSGSGPAFFALIMDRLIDAAIDEGLSREDAIVLIGQTMLGTARLLVEQQLDPKILVAAVSSKGGTSEAGLKVLDCETTTRLLRDTIRHAAARSAELSVD